ncbi:hypothetical protein R8510_02820 [Ralstonia chuxiongensis]|nr:hypothetical protein R8510_02820 [Ralstonia chuxiongensis]
MTSVSARTVEKPVWRKWAFGVSFLIGPVVGAALVGLVFAVLTCERLADWVEYFVWGVMLFGIFGIGVGLVLGPLWAYWYFLVRPYRR